jgi:hypothetical protein
VLKRDARAVEAETWDLVLGTCAQFAHVKMALEIYYVVTQDYGKKTVSPHFFCKIQFVSTVAVQNLNQIYKENLFPDS